MANHAFFGSNLNDGPRLRISDEWEDDDAGQLGFWTENCGEDAFVLDPNAEALLLAILQRRAEQRKGA